MTEIQVSTKPYLKRSGCGPGRLYQDELIAENVKFTSCLRLRAERRCRIVGRGFHQEIEPSLRFAPNELVGSMKSPKWFDNGGSTREETQ